MTQPLVSLSALFEGQTVKPDSLGYDPTAGIPRVVFEGQTVKPDSLGYDPYHNTARRLSLY